MGMFDRRPASESRLNRDSRGMTDDDRASDADRYGRWQTAASPANDNRQSGSEDRRRGDRRKASNDGEWAFRDRRQGDRREPAIDRRQMTVDVRTEDRRYDTDRRSTEDRR